MRGSRRRRACLAAAVPAVACLAAPGVASGSPRVGAPRMQLVRVTSSSFSVAATASHATRYRLFADTDRRQLSVAPAGKARRSSLSAATPSISGLPATTKPYYYRVEAINGRRHSWSGVSSLHLRPPVPHAVRAHSNRRGLFLTWRGQLATGFVVVQATNLAMTEQRRTYTLRGNQMQFTPYGLVKGATYYFQVLALNQTTPSAFSRVVQATAVTAEQPLRVMTYNIMTAGRDGTTKGGQKVAPWSQRQYGVAALIRQANPDVVAIEEGGCLVGGDQRQVDELARLLSGSYSLAITEPFAPFIPPMDTWERTGVYILYKTATYQPVPGEQWNWQLGQNRSAVWALMQNKQTGSRFLFMTTHLSVGSGVRGDQERLAETRTLMHWSSTRATRFHAPIVYAGDFNSHPLRRKGFDGPGLLMNSQGIADAFLVAQHVTDAKYDSGNGYLRKPAAHGLDIDHVYAPPGVGVGSWQLVLNLRNGRFVGTIPSDHNPVVADVFYPY